jgi:hypothetical protein
VDNHASDALNWLTRVGNHALGLPPSVNFVDPTDLLALPFIVLGCWQGWRSVPSSPAPYSGQPVLREQR